MPIYEYRCGTCGRPSSVFFRSLAVVDPDPPCPRCGARTLERRMSRVWVHGAGAAPDEGEAFADADPPTSGYDDPYADDPTGAGDDDIDPATFAREAREMARMMGEPLDADFDTALRHIERGADPDDVFGEMDSAEADSGAAEEP